MLGESAVGTGIVLPGSQLQLVNRSRIPRVTLTGTSPLKLSRIGQGGQTVRLIFRVSQSMSTQRFLLEEIKRRLDEAGIEIPFPQRVVTILSGEGEQMPEPPKEIQPPKEKRPPQHEATTATGGVVDQDDG